MEPLLPKKDVNKCDDCDSKLVEREDDKEDIIRSRLNTYYDHNQKFIDFYREKNLVVDFEPKKGIKDYPTLRKIFEENCLNNTINERIVKF
jgi:adenylate kinase